MRKSLILAALIAVAATSCVKEVMQETGDLGNFTIRATREACGDANTKASISSSDGTFTWSAGDAIGIWNGSSFQELTTQNDKVASATFTGMISGTLQDCAVYPYAIVENSKSVSTVTLPDTYEWKEGEVASPMYAAYDADGLSFKHLGGVVMVTLNNVPATATKFVLSANKDITGDYTVTTDNDNNKCIQSAGTENTKNEVAFTFTLKEVTNMVFYVPVPVGDYIFSLKVLNSSDETLSSKNGKTTNSVKRKVLKKMQALTCGSISGGGEGSTSTTSLPAGHEGKFYLPDTDTDVVVNVEGDCTTSAVKLCYASGGAEPANVTINAGTNTIKDFSIELPNSHVDVVGGTYENFTSQTSDNTLVLDNTVKITKALAVAGGSVEIAGTVQAVAVQETVGDKATVKVAEGATITDKLEVAKAASIEIAGTVPTVTVTSTETAPVVTVTSTANIATKLDVANAESVKVEGTVTAVNVDKASSVEVAGKVDAVAVKTDVSSVTIATPVKTIEVTASESSSQTQDDSEKTVIWVTESGSVTESVTDKTNTGTDASGSSISIVAASTDSGTSTGQIKEVKNSSGSTVANAVKSPSEYMTDKIKTGGTITLEDDITGYFTIESGSAVVNLNGKTISNTESDKATFTVNSGATLTINGKGSITNAASGNPAIQNNGKLVVTEGVSISRVLDGSSDVYSYVGSETALSAALADTGVKTIILNGDIDLTGTISAANAQTIDINGHKVTAKAGGSFTGIANLTPKGEGTILDTYYAATETAVNAAIAVTGINKIVLTSNIDLLNPIRISRALTLNLDGKVLKAVTNSARTKYDDAVIIVKRGGDLTITGNGTVTSNNLEKVYAAVKLTEYNDTGDAAAKLTIENGDFVGYYYAIVGQGTRHNTEITIKGGTFSGSAPTAQSIYHPQYGKLTISGGTFNGVNSAVELRAGTLNISGGNFTSTATVFEAKPNGSGSTIAGAALAISQHTTDKDIDVKVTGGTFSGIYAIYENDIQNNTGNVSVSVGSGATLSGKVYCEHNAALNSPKDVIHVSNEADLLSALSGTKEIVLTTDIVLAKTVVLASGSSAVIDLGGHRLSAASTALYKYGDKDNDYRVIMIAVKGAKLTIKNGILGNDILENGKDEVNCTRAIYSTSTQTDVTLKDVTSGRNCNYAFNGSGKFTAENCKFCGWLSGWHQGGTFTNCEFNIGKAYYASAICYGNTTFTSCKFFKNGVNADEYKGPDTDGYYRHNYVVAACEPAETISFTSCKFIDASGAETTVKVDSHPYHDRDCPHGWGDGKAVAGTVTVDGNAVTSQCCDKPWAENVKPLTPDKETGNYLITSASELAWVAQQVNAGTENFSGKTLILQNDINLYDRAWTPIGNASNPFKGSFNGQNHKISNLNIHSDNGGSEPLGLFGNVYGDKGDITGIKNLIIDGAEIISEKTSEGCGVAAGLFSGHAVADNVKVINATVKNAHYVGGIAGQAYGYFRNCTVESTKLVAYTELVTDKDGNTSYDYGDKVGGIVGQFCEGSRDITNCKAIKVEITGYRDLGGIAGMAHDNTTVTGCSVDQVTITIDKTCNYKNLDGTADAHNVHSIIGRKGSNQTDSENTGTATINSK